MRVIAGRLGGRNFSSPHSHRTHPMSDKVRGALFNALGDLDSLSVLDAYAGSGACGIEAVSRGANHVLAIDVDPEAVKTIAGNAKTLELTKEIIVRRSSISGWMQNHAAELFDVVLADPPYNDIRTDVLGRLATHVCPGGLFVLSWPGAELLPLLPGLKVVRHKIYGDAQLGFYRRSG